MEYYLLAYLAVLLAYPPANSGNLRRYLVPLIPFLIFYFAYDVRWAVTALRLRRPVLAGSAPAVGVTIAVLALFGAANLFETARASVLRVRPEMFDFRQYTDFDSGWSVARWAGANTPAGSLISTQDPYGFYSWSERQVTWHPYVPPGAGGDAVARGLVAEAWTTWRSTARRTRRSRRSSSTTPTPSSGSTLGAPARCTRSGARAAPRRGAMSAEPSTWLVVPAYNEEPVLAGALAGLEPLPYRVVVVDAAPPTPPPRWRRGRAWRSCATRATSARGPRSRPASASPCASPARASRDLRRRRPARPEDVRALLEPLEEGVCDVALGSRFLVPGSAVRIPGARRPLLRVATVVTRLSTGLRLSDTPTGCGRSPGAPRRSSTHPERDGARVGDPRADRGARPALPRGAGDGDVQPVPLTKGQSMLNSVDIFWESIRGRSG